MLNSLQHQLRREIMAHRQNMVRDLLLNDGQIQLVREIAKQNIMTASQLSISRDISIQNASSKLNRLYKAGYIIRRSTAAASGGLEYVYQSYWN